MPESGGTGKSNVAKWLVGVAVLVAIVVIGKSILWPPVPKCPEKFMVVVGNKAGNPCNVAPQILHARRGDVVLFVNATSEDVVFEVENDATVFVGGNRIEVPAGGTRCRTVSSDAPTGVLSKIRITPDPNQFCPDLDGPGVEIDG